MVRKQTGRIFEGPRGGQWTAAKSKRLEVEQLNSRIDRKQRKAIKRSTKKILGKKTKVKFGKGK